MGLAYGTACPPESGCAKRYSAQPIDKGFVSKLQVAFREQLGIGEDWDPIKKENPCPSVLLEAYLKFVTQQQNRLGVPVKSGGTRVDSYPSPRAAGHRGTGAAGGFGVRTHL